MNKKAVIKLAITQLKKDLNNGDTEAIEELLEESPLEALETYLPENPDE